MPWLSMPRILPTPIVVSIRLDDLGNKPATQHATGPISDELLASYLAAGSPIYALFTDAKLVTTDQEPPVTM